MSNGNRHVLDTGDDELDRLSDGGILLGGGKQIAEEAEKYSHRSVLDESTDIIKVEGQRPCQSVSTGKIRHVAL